MTGAVVRRDNRGSPMLFVALAWSLAQVPEPPAPVDDVVWVAPPGCPGRAELIEGVERRRRRPLVPGQLRVDATVTPGPGKLFTLQISLATGAREDRRTLRADRCAALVDAAALLITVAIDEQSASTPAPGDAPGDVPDDAPEGGASTPAPGDAPGDVAPTPTTPADAAPTSENAAPEIAAPEDAAPAVTGSTSAAEPDDARPTTPPRPRPGGFVRAQGGLALGTVPGAAGVASLAAGVLWRRIRLEVQPLFIAPRTTTREGHALQAWLIAAAVSGCYRAGRAALEVPLCAGFEGGVMRGVATGATQQGAANGGWLAVLVGTGVVWRVHRSVGLWLGVQGTGAIRRPRFVLRGSAGEEELFRPLPVTLRVLAGVELRFGDPR